MIRLGKTTRKEGAKILDQAMSYFGPHGLGLEIENRTSDAIRFSGGGGHIQVTVSEDGGGTDVDIQSREWDLQAQDFLEKI